MNRFSDAVALVLVSLFLIGGACAAEKTTAQSEKETRKTTPDAKPASDWPVFRGNALSTGVARATLPEKLSVLWRYRVKDGAFEATAVIAGGTVYLGDLDGTFYALDLKTGEEKWTFKHEAGFSASAAYRDGLVYVGDIDGKFFCLEAATGKEKWTAGAEAEINGGPNFHGDNVLFGSQDATLYCLDAKTGKVTWKHTIDDQIRCAPTIVADRAFLAGCDGHLHVIDVTKGEQVASVEIESPTGSTPAAHGDHVYFGTEGSVFFNVNWREAEVVWKYSDEKRSLPFRSSAAVTDELIVFGGRDKLVHALDPASGAALWTFPTKSRVDSSPVVVGDRIFVGSSDGRLYALDRKTGKKVWDYDAGGDFVASPAVVDGRLVIANTDGVVYCFGEE